MEATSVITDKYLAGWRGCDRAEDLQAEARAAGAPSSKICKIINSTILHYTFVNSL